MKDEAGMPTRYNNARKAIDEAIAMSHNLKQFQYELSVMGYHSNLSPNRKYATIIPKGSEKPIRTYRLGEDYTKERILERLIQNRDNIAFVPFQPKTYRVRQYSLPTREEKIKKVGGLYGLYLHYCYRLSYLPKYKMKQQNPARLHYLLKDDLIKLDELTAQTTLLGRNHIGTDEQLFSYKQSVEVEIKTLKIIRSCDFAIIYYLDDEDTDEGYKYIKNWKNNHYSFEERRLSQNADYKLEEILDYEQGWNMIRDEYIKLKNSNRDCNKKSFVLYLESIHNVYNHIQQENEESQPTAINLLRYW